MEADELQWDDVRSLMEQLVERVLPVGPRFSEDHRSGGVAHLLSVRLTWLSVAFHIQLLQMAGKRINAWE
jgi:hypothetical protein